MLASLYERYRTALIKYWISLENTLDDGDVAFPETYFAENIREIDACNSDRATSIDYKRYILQSACELLYTVIEKDCTS